MATMAEGEETAVIAKYDYTAENGQELSIKKSERLILLDNSKDWWRVKNADNKQGYVPSNYVKMAKPRPSIFSSLLKNRTKKQEGVQTAASPDMPLPVRKWEHAAQTAPGQCPSHHQPASTFYTSHCEV